MVLLVLAAGCGRLGFDDDVHTDAGPTTCVAQVSGGWQHTCALHGDGTIHCWGLNSKGEIGDGTIGPHPLPTLVTESAGGAPFRDVTQISMGEENTSCARRTDGTAWCWGDNAQGEVGDGTTTIRPSPTQVMAAPGVPLVDVIDVQAGGKHACARTSDESLWCWGSNLQNQLGDGTATSSLFPVRVMSASGPFAGVRGVNNGEDHVVAWGPGGQLFAWGSGMEGKLGTGSVLNEPFARVVAVSQVVSVGNGCCHTCASTETGHAYCFGRGNGGQIGDGAVAQRSTPVAVLDAPGGSPFLVATIATGDNYTCALRDDATLWCWGDNSYGQTGNRNLATPMLPSPTRVELADVTALGTGNRHACAVLTGDTLLCWGENTEGQLGNGSLMTTATPTAVPLPCP